MLLGNEEIREFNAYLFNDTFLALYVVICVYLVSQNKPLWAALFLTMSLSIKAGAMLMVPCFFGWIQF
jgi:Gpi18-like mannosyltransferase